jgi:hypothetical protein
MKQITAMEDRTVVADVSDSAAPARSVSVTTGAVPSGVAFIDDFGDDRPPGHVVGSATSNGVVRLGVDAERVVSIDRGALRFQPLVKPRWGRSGIAYGPYGRRNGLTFAVSALNGHNTSQTGALPEGLKLRLRRWALGSETEPAVTRLRRWIRSGSRRFFWRRLLHWALTGSRFLQTVTIDENFAVGWFPRAIPTDPAHEGNALLMHAVGPECGELWARVGQGSRRTVRGMQNVQLYYVVVLRDRGAAYYVASVPDVPGVQPYPYMAPVAIDAFNDAPELYAGIHQSVLGQVGFRVDTRVYRAQVAQLDAYSDWFGTAIGADDLTGAGSLAGSPASIGGRWDDSMRGFQRTAGGVRTLGPTRATLQLDQPAGLIHVLVETDALPTDGIALVWRYRNPDNFWSFETGSSGCHLSITENGVTSRFPATRDQRLLPNAVNSLQVSDDGHSFRVYLNGDLAYGTEFCDARLSECTGVGLQRTGVTTNGWLRRFEAHPRRLSIPVPLELEAPWAPKGQVIVARDEFGGDPGDLAGRTTSVGSRTWRREVGRGQFMVNDDAARVRATLKDPCPGRTAYTIPWHNAAFADLSVRITPPGTKPGAGERGRGGIIFWQDAQNYITLSIFLDDWYGTSIAAFFYRDGYEELYDAVWSNIGRRVYWGIPYDFRAVFDGTQFTAYVNGEPILYRALRDVYSDWAEQRIARVGLVANWEWGADTGSAFHDFVARDRE